MKTIIVATDFSKEAENALLYAAGAAKQLKSNVIIFNSYTVPRHAGNSLFPASGFLELIEYNNNILKQKALELAKEFSIEVGYESSLMDVNEELEVLIKKYNADLVIMGMAPKSINQDLFGNTTTSAITKFKFPVLAIPLGAKFTGIKKILFACDILRGVHEPILEKIKNFSLAMGAEIEIFSVYQKLNLIGKSQDITNEIEEALKDVNHSYKNVESDRILAEIDREVKSFGADILVMLPHEYGFWGSLIHQSRTRIMASKSEVPLLSIAL